MDNASELNRYQSLLEGFGNCVEAFCQFDSNGQLVSWDSEFESFYPPLKELIRPGLKYRDFVLGLYKRSALRNIQHIENLDNWLNHQEQSIGKEPIEFVHELLDGRTMLIKHRVLSDGNWLFSAIDVSVLQKTADSIMGDDQFQSFAHLSSDWFWELDENLCYLYHSNHKQPLAGPSPESLVGKSRVLELSGMVIENDQFHLHNEMLLRHQFVDVTLSWKMSDSTHKHSKILAQPRYSDSGEFAGYIGCGRDVTREYEMRQQLAYLADHDDLTGLLSRRAFAVVLDENLASCKKTYSKVVPISAPQQYALLSINLDCFKMINEDVGHTAGDRLLTEITRLVFQHFGPKAVVGRLGGDEFGVTVAMDQVEALESATHLIKIIGDYNFSWKNRKFSISARAGIIGINTDSKDSSELLSKVEIACHCAKLSGRNQALLYNNQNSLQAQQNDELDKLKLLKYAMHNNGLHLFLQPIVATTDYIHGLMPEVMKFEVLLRVRDQNHTLISPGEVIPVAEKYDMMHRLDLWVVESAINYIHTFRSKGVAVSLSVNLSGNTLSNAASLNHIAELFDKYQVESGSLCLEITETAAIKSMEQVCEFIKRLKLLGCDFSLDDFGSGLSSFGYLKALQVDFLKIDGSFVKNICTDSASRAIVASFNTLGHEMNMKTVAEFVEDDEIVGLLKELDIDYLQGFGVGVPRDVTEWLAELEPPEAIAGS